MGLSVVAVFMLSGTMSTSQIVAAQASGQEFELFGANLSAPGWYAILLAPSFIIFFIAIVGETNRAPFDLPEAESELVAGYMTEYSSLKFLLFMLSEYVAMVAMSAATATLFLGGWRAPAPVTTIWAGANSGWWPMLWFFIKVVLLVFVFVWLRATLPRLRYDQFMKLGWRVLLPINLVWILSLAALQVYRDPNTGDEKFVILGGFLVGVVLLALLWPSSKREPDRPLEEQLKRLQSDVDNHEKEQKQNRTMLASVQADLNQNESESVKQIEDLNQYKLKKEEATQQLEFKRAARTALSRKLELEESETKEQRTQLRAVDDQLRQTEIGVNRLDVELENILKKLSEDYELSYELAKQRYPIPEDITAAQNEVRDLKRSITSLGDVNLGAIEEYQRVNERYLFLSEQKADLVEAKTTLYQVIKEMDDEMSKRFKLTFDAIRREFGTVFTKLFGGGRADLVLIDPDRLLETGIDIVAQPPGKKLQNLQLLSGGERALTAMALLFAILQVKPVPFCVLDEVEAALDEANVVRFAQYLREFSEQTQFIVVTHRKGTMEEADVLYGVTMEEGGVSKLVSVKLENEEAEIS